MGQNDEPTIQMKEGSFKAPAAYIQRSYWVPFPLKLTVKVKPDSTNDGIEEEQSVFVLVLRKADGTSERYCYSQLSQSGTSLQVIYRQHKLTQKPDGNWEATVVPRNKVIARVNLTPRIVWLERVKTTIRVKILRKRIETEGVLLFNPNRARELDEGQRRKARNAYQVALERFLDNGEIELARIFNTSDDHTQEWVGSEEDGTFMSMINSEIFSGEDVVAVNDDDIDDILGDPGSVIADKAQPPAPAKTEETEAKEETAPAKEPAKGKAKGKSGEDSPLPDVEI